MSLVRTGAEGTGRWKRMTEGTWLQRSQIIWTNKNESLSPYVRKNISRLITEFNQRTNKSHYIHGRRLQKHYTCSLHIYRIELKSADPHDNIKQPKKRETERLEIQTSWQTDGSWSNPILSNQSLSGRQKEADVASGRTARREMRASEVYREHEDQRTWRVGFHQRDRTQTTLSPLKLGPPS